MKIAIFGGTFDPIHNAHLGAAMAAKDRFELDQVLIIPASNPPHKLERRTESYEDRYRMVEIACCGIDGLQPSRLEAGLARSYSIHTIERIQATIAPGDQLYFVIGADAFAEVRTWYRWPEVIATVEFIVVTRPGHSYDAPAAAKVHRLESIAMEVSSSAIRAALAAGLKPPELPEEVFEYIRERRLYGFGMNSVQP